MCFAKIYLIVACLLWSACEDSKSNELQYDGRIGNPVNPVIDSGNCGIGLNPDPTPHLPQASSDFAQCIDTVFFNSQLFSSQLTGGTTSRLQLTGKPSFIVLKGDEAEDEQHLMSLVADRASKGERPVFLLAANKIAYASHFDNTHYAAIAGIQASSGITTAGSVFTDFDKFATILVSYESCLCLQKHGMSIGNEHGNAVVGLGKLAQTQQNNWIPKSEFAKTGGDQYIGIIRMPDDISYDDLAAAQFLQTDPNSASFSQCRLMYLLRNKGGNLEELLLIGTGTNSDQIESRIIQHK